MFCCKQCYTRKQRERERECESARESENETSHGHHRIAECLHIEMQRYDVKSQYDE